MGIPCIDCYDYQNRYRRQDVSKDTNSFLLSERTSRPSRYNYKKRSNSYYWGEEHVSKWVDDFGFHDDSKSVQSSRRFSTADSEKFCGMSLEPCICMNTRLLEELGICIKLECVHGGNMNKFWRVMGRDCSGYSSNADESSERCLSSHRSTPEPLLQKEPERVPEPAYKKHTRGKSSLADLFSSLKEHSRPTTAASESMETNSILAITVTKTVEIQSEDIQSYTTRSAYLSPPKSRGRDRGRAVAREAEDKSNMKCVYTGRFGGGVKEVSKNGYERIREDEEEIVSPLPDPAFETARSTQTTPTVVGSETACPREEKSNEDRNVVLHVSYQEVTDLLRKNGMSPKKVLRMAGWVGEVFGRVYKKRISLSDYFDDKGMEREVEAWRLG